MDQARRSRRVIDNRANNTTETLRLKLQVWLARGLQYDSERGFTAQMQPAARPVPHLHPLHLSSSQVQAAAAQAGTSFLCSGRSLPFFATQTDDHYDQGWRAAGMCCCRAMACRKSLMRHNCPQDFCIIEKRCSASLVCKRHCPTLFPGKDLRG